MGIKKERIKRVRAVRLVGLKRRAHWPLLQASASVAKKKVRAKLPAQMPKKVPQKKWAKEILVNPMPKFMGVNGKKTRRR